MHHMWIRVTLSIILHVIVTVILQLLNFSAFQRGECKRGNKCRFAHPVTPQTPKDAAIVAGAPKMYSADDVFAKKAKIV